MNTLKFHDTILGMILEPYRIARKLCIGHMVIIVRKATNANQFYNANYFANLTYCLCFNSLSFGVSQK
jgi:hypothetical protein